MSFGTTCQVGFSNIFAGGHSTYAMFGDGLGDSDLDDIVFRVDEFPTDEVLDELELESPFDLMGLYQGVDLARKSVADPAPEPDMIFLYRRPILDYWCETGEDLAHLVAHVVIHEIGHHWGLSDEDMERIEAEAD